MPMSEDERFESYLRNFRPRPPSLPPRRRRGKVRRFLISVSVAAGILVAALVGSHFRAAHRYLSRTSEDVPKANSTPRAGPLTTEGANAALFRNSSVNAALDQMAFSPRSNPPSAGQVSALELLGRRNDEY